MSVYSKWLYSLIILTYPANSSLAETVDIDEGEKISISCVGFSDETDYEEITDEQMIFLLEISGKSNITQNSKRVSRDYIFEISDGIITRSDNDSAFYGKPAVVTESYIDLYKNEVAEGEAVFRISRINGKLGDPGNGNEVLTRSKIDFSNDFSIRYSTSVYNVTCSPLEQKF